MIEAGQRRQPIGVLAREQIDNGFRDPAAYEFVNDAAARLGVDLVTDARTASSPASLLRP